MKKSLYLRVWFWGVDGEWECGVSGCSAARLARVVRDDEVESSNLSTPTNSGEEAVVSLFFYFFGGGEGGFLKLLRGLGN